MKKELLAIFNMKCLLYVDDNFYMRLMNLAVNQLMNQNF